MSTKFEHGQKVIVSPDAKSSYGGVRGNFFDSGYGWIVSNEDSDGDCYVRTSESEDSDCWYVLAKFLSPAFPRPITFDEVKIGDTVRLTEVYKNGESMVKTITISGKDFDNDLVSTSGSMYITAGVVARNNSTLELLARPEPAKVYKAGDVITRDEIKNLPNHTVITTGESDGETVRIFVDGKLYNEMAARLGGLRPEEMHEDWTFTVRYVSEVEA